MGYTTTTIEVRRRYAINLIELERQHQESHKAAGRFRYTCADNLSPALKFAILTEEIGEVARELLSIEGLVTDGDQSWQALRKELVQVAAISLAWLESLVEE